MEAAGADAFGEEWGRIVATLMLAIVLALGGVLLFIEGLHIPLRAIAW